MLFRRFMWITVSAAIMGVILSNIIHATYPDGRSLNMENRAQQWRKHDAKKACQINNKYCGLTLAYINQA